MPRSSPRFLALVVPLAAALLALAPPLRAQQRAEAAVLLQLRPRVGDTLRTRLDQQTEITMTMPGTNAVAASARSSTTRAFIASRTIVQSAVATSTTVLTVVDSASFSSSDMHAASLVAEAERSLEGQQLVLQLGWDGSVESARDARTGRMSREVADAMSAMPAVFPRKSVTVGEQWTREMPLPTGGPMGARSSGTVKATFRLDSLLRGGRLAFVSMQGTIVPDGGGAVAVTGTMSGEMQLDRERGWMTDSRIVVMMRSALRATAGASAPPTRFVTRVTQRLRTMDRH